MTLPVACAGGPMPRSAQRVGAMSIWRMMPRSVAAATPGPAIVNDAYISGAWGSSMCTLCGAVLATRSPDVRAEGKYRGASRM